MSRLSKYLLLLALIVFILACNFVTQPIRDAQEVVGTAQSIASAMPLETLQSFATNMPVETLQAVSSAMPNFEDMFNPQGEPVEVWKDIPIMPQATAGQEFDNGVYSFKADATLKEAQDFYDARLSDLGWNQPFKMPAEGDGAIMIFQKDNSALTITMASVENSIVVILTLA